MFTAHDRQGDPNENSFNLRKPSGLDEALGTEGYSRVRQYLLTRSLRPWSGGPLCL